GWTREDGFYDPRMNSFNHYSLGSVGEWLFRQVAGIELDPDAPGFQRFCLRPFVAKELDFVRARYRSMHGEIMSEWRQAGGGLNWTVRIPANTSARVCVPSEPGTAVTEGGAPAEKADGLRVVGRDGQFLVCEAAAGAYNFASRWRDWEQQPEMP
ncbi:MAG: alpha-L-rhamnosidase, partial [Verrucomicrobia bacterium]|nr:alpha-L-rhamnosidase [Verrucomicrobiota bacterium]